MKEMNRREMILGMVGVPVLGLVSKGSNQVPLPPDGTAGYGTYCLLKTEGDHFVVFDEWAPYDKEIYERMVVLRKNYMENLVDDMEKSFWDLNVKPVLDENALFKDTRRGRILRKQE